MLSAKKHLEPASTGQPRSRDVSLSKATGGSSGLRPSSLRAVTPANGATKLVVRTPSGGETVKARKPGKVYHDEAVQRVQEWNQKLNGQLDSTSVARHRADEQLRPTPLARFAACRRSRQERCRMQGERMYRLPWASSAYLPSPRDRRPSLSQPRRAQQQLLGLSVCCKRIYTPMECSNGRRSKTVRIGMPISTLIYRSRNSTRRCRLYRQ